ncbi:MAG: hypothetical protein KC933_18330, partial [Myxococcales bacterium]|nr:hypothetical protein [Myxococcales bacterium]
MARALLVAAGLLALLAPRHASAQTPYIIGHSVGTWAPISGGVAHPPVAYGVFPALDEGAVELPLPFPFSWYGEPQTTAWAYTNGFLGFLPPNTVGILRPPRTVPSPANPMHAFIGALWLDLNGGATAAIRTE